MSIDTAVFPLSIYRVELSRKRTEGSALTLPDPYTCARYGLTEGAECDDANLRLDRTGDFRNNARNDDPRKEWGQCGYMILSALIQLPNAQHIYAKVGDRLHTLYELEPRPMRWYASTMNCLAQYLIEHVTLHPFAVSGQSLCWAFMYWAQYATLRGWEPAKLIDETCTAFEAKHCTPEGVTG